MITKLFAVPALAAGLLLLVACGGGGGTTGSTHTPDPQQPTPEVASYHGAVVSSSRVRDGVSAARIVEYWLAHTDTPTPGLATFPNAPVVRMAEGMSEKHRGWVRKAVAQFNEFLPYDKRIMIGDPAPPRTLLDDVPDGQIFVNITPTPAEWNPPGDTSEGAGRAHILGQATFEYDQDDERFEVTGQRRGVINIALDEGFSDAIMFAAVRHELGHGIGFAAHPADERFPDSIMSGTGHWRAFETLPMIDGEALWAGYTRFEPGTQPEDISEESLGPWTEWSFNLRGNIAGGITFGAGTRNGLARAWASGPESPIAITSNRALSGTVTWNGAMLGFTPAGNTVTGATAVELDLASASGNAAFTGLESWGAFTAPGEQGQGAIWGDGDLHYMIAVNGNALVQTGGDAGLVTGTFFGNSHQGMGGTLVRADLTAAFGGTR